MEKNQQKLSIEMLFVNFFTSYSMQSRMHIKQIFAYE